MVCTHHAGQQLPLHLTIAHVWRLSTATWITDRRGMQHQYLETAMPLGLAWIWMRWTISCGESSVVLKESLHLEVVLRGRGNA